MTDKTDKVNDGGPEEAIMVRGRLAIPEEPKDVEAHQTHKGKDGGPEGQTHKGKFTGEDDDVEGHSQNMKK